MPNCAYNLWAHLLVCIFAATRALKVAHSNDIVRCRVVGSLVMKQYSFFVPKGVDLAKLIAATPPSIPKFRLEKVLYILDVMTQIPARNHDVGDDNGYVPLNASILRDNIGKRYYLYLDWLVKCGVLECNNHFNPDLGISRKYKFTEQYYQPIQECKVPISAWMARKVDIGATVQHPGTQDWWEYATKVPISASLQNKLPAHNSELNQDDREEFYDWMRSLYPSLFRWYDQNGLQIDTHLANSYNDALFRFRTQGYQDIDTRWNRKKAMQLPKSPISQHRSNTYNMADLVRQNYYPHFDPNVMRLYSSIVSMNKELRPAISWQGQPLAAVDISNSQPYLLAALLNPDFWMNDGRDKSTVTIYDLPYHNNYIHLYPTTDIITLCNFLEQTQPPDVKLFKQIVTSGKFYERLAQLLPPPQSGKVYTRSEMKRQMFIVLFTENAAIKQPWAKPKRDFAKLFPSINNLIQLIQTTGAPNLPCLLQRLESHLMFNHIMPRITVELPEAPVFTIHDGIATLQGSERIIARILREELHYATGNIPSYKYECWDAGKLRYDLNWNETLFEYLREYYLSGLGQSDIRYDAWVDGLIIPFTDRSG